MLINRKQKVTPENYLHDSKYCHKVKITMLIMCLLHALWKHKALYVLYLILQLVKQCATNQPRSYNSNSQCGFGEEEP